MSNLRRWWCLVVCLGVIANLTFAAIVLFGNATCLLAAFRLGGVSSTVWLYNYSVLLALLSLFYLPAALDPIAYRANAWLLIAARLIPATTFFLGVLAGYMAPGFAMLGVADAGFGVLELGLLIAVLASEREAVTSVARPSLEQASA
jgi:hypothetical protein